MNNLTTQKEELIQSIKDTKRKLESLEQRLKDSERRYEVGDFAYYEGKPVIVVGLSHKTKKVLVYGIKHSFGLHSGNGLSRTIDSWIDDSPFAYKCYWVSPNSLTDEL